MVDNNINQDIQKALKNIEGFLFSEKEVNNCSYSESKTKLAESVRKLVNGYKLSDTNFTSSVNGLKNKLLINKISKKLTGSKKVAFKSLVFEEFSSDKLNPINLSEVKNFLDMVKFH